MRKSTKRILASMAMLVVTAVGLTGCGKTTEDTNKKVELQILATSDIHGRFVPYDYAINE